MTRVLLVGGDGRSDCIADAIAKCGASLDVFSNVRDHPGLRRKARVFRVGQIGDVGEVLDFAREVRPDLVIVGPEDPLARGVVDAIQRDLGTPCVGPTRALARIESSKSFTRTLLDRHDIPGRVEHRVFTAESVEEIEGYLRRVGAFVVKADGLMGGKGVKVFGEQLTSVEEALGYARSLLAKGPVVIEEKIEGEEFSLQSFCDGETIVHTIPVQDHKRAYEGDTGPNTGGMGSYSSEDHSLPFLRPEHVAAAREINARVVKALQEEVGEPYRGVLYGGFMATGRDVRLLEYNARFGDPEAMNVIPLLEGDFLDLCLAMATGRLGATKVAFRRQATVCKYLVPRGYPDAPVKDEVLSLASLPSPTDELRVYFAAVEETGCGLVMTGSRALAVVGIADSVRRAGEIAERAIAGVEGAVEHRRDIGTPELVARRVAHLDALRGALDR